jgi:5-methylcytosine-specific restriction endonuclease McrA
MNRHADTARQLGSALESTALSFVVRAAPWLGPLPTAWLVYDRTITHLGWPAWVAIIAALSLELMGIAIADTALRLRDYNRTKRVSDPPAPERLPIILMALYLLVAEGLTVMLDVLMKPRTEWITADIAPAIFPILSVTATAILAIHNEHEARMRAVAEEKERARRARQKKRAAQIAYTECQVCEQELAPKYVKDGLCQVCTRRAQGETHHLPLHIAIPVLERDNWTCYYCGEDLTLAGERERHLDHFIPKSKEGQDIVDNLVTSCQQCNLSKGDRLPSEKERWEFAQYLKAKQAGPDKKSQILALAFSDNGDIATKQADIARILRTSQGYVSSVVSEHERSLADNDKPEAQQ